MSPARWRGRERADPDAVPRLRHGVVTFGAELGLDGRVLEDVALAVSEAATNVVLHAYLAREPGPLTVEAETGRDAFVVRVRDEGVGMRPRPDSPGLGLGLPTIGQVCAHVDIDQPVNGGTELRMVFHVPGLAGPEADDDAQRIRRRLEGILGALEDAVTVNDAQGRLLFANDAAARLLGAASVEELLSAQPGELAARFESTLADGTPLTVDHLPGRQVLAGRKPEPLLTRSVEKATGRERWTRTTARLLDEDPPLAVNVVHDVTDEMRPS